MMRERVLRLASRALSGSGLARAVERINGVRGGVVLAYHDISTDALTRQLSVVARWYRFVSLDEMADRLDHGTTTTGLAAITFDDGLGAVIERAAGVAARERWPMTFYLPTRYLDTGEPYWFQELTPLISASRAERITIGGSTFPLSSPAGKGRAREAIGNMFRRLDTVTRVEELLAQVRRALTGSDERPSGLALPEPPAWPRVRDLAAREELAFEAHSVNHLPMSLLDDAAVLHEMEASRERVEEMTGRGVRHFCYPFGEPPQIGRRAPEVARRIFRSAVTMERGRWMAGSHPGFLPRVALYEKDSDEVVSLKLGLAR